MNSYLSIALIFLMSNFYSNPLIAQEKYEKESRLKPEEVPSLAISAIDSVNSENAVKWYLEEGLESKTIEAKFKLNDTKYSVEFDLNGRIEDIEIEAKWNDLESPLQNAIVSQLKKDCLKHKVGKIQIQYSGNQSDLLALLEANKIDERLAIKYEVIVKCRSEKKVELFEYLFSTSGKPILISKIIFKSSNHLEY